MNISHQGHISFKFLGRWRNNYCSLLIQEFPNTKLQNNSDRKDNIADLWHTSPLISNTWRSLWINCYFRQKMARESRSLALSNVSSNRFKATNNMTSHGLKSRSVYFILRSVASKKQIITESNERKTGLRRLANNFPITVLLYLFNIIALHIYVGGNFFLNFYSKLWMFSPFLNVLLSDSFSCLLAGETKQTKHSTSRKKQKNTTYSTYCCATSAT